MNTQKLYLINRADSDIREYDKEDACELADYVYNKLMNTRLCFSDYVLIEGNSLELADFMEEHGK